MSEHKKTITAISWCPHNAEVFASASADNLLIVWNVAEQKVVARLDNTKGTAGGGRGPPAHLYEGWGGVCDVCVCLTCMCICVCVCVCMTCMCVCVCV